MLREVTQSVPRFRRTAEVRPSSFEEADNSVEVVWTTGAAVPRFDWRSGRNYIEELVVSSNAVRLQRLNSGAPLLDTHNDWSLRSIIGVVVAGTARIEGGKGLARVRLSGVPEDASKVQKIRDGLAPNISVGYAIHRVEKIVGREGIPDVWRVVDWEPMEISSVPIPADPGSQVRADAKAAAFPCAFTIAGAASTPAAARMRLRARALGL